MMRMPRPVLAARAAALAASVAVVAYLAVVYGQKWLHEQDDGFMYYDQYVIQNHQFYYDGVIDFAAYVLFSASRTSILIAIGVVICYSLFLLLVLRRHYLITGTTDWMRAVLFFLTVVCLVPLVWTLYWTWRPFLHNVLITGHNPYKGEQQEYDTLVFFAPETMRHLSDLVAQIIPFSTLMLYFLSALAGAGAAVFILIAYLPYYFTRSEQDMEPL